MSYPLFKFARLLFDRMLESFRRSAEISLGTPEQNALGELLPSLFGGTTVYVTKCDECGFCSKRSEDFMEISVPIVDLDEERTGKQTGKTKQGGHNKSTANDVDVQRCLNTYLCHENLDGDNQYECSV